jgi:hypothetical protein
MKKVIQGVPKELQPTEETNTETVQSHYVVTLFYTFCGPVIMSPRSDTQLIFEGKGGATISAYSQRKVQQRTYYFGYVYFMSVCNESRTDERAVRQSIR